MHLRLLRICLGFAGVTWGVSVMGVFMNWQTAVEALQGFGAMSVGYDPMLDYWLRMAAGAFTMIGCWFLVMTTWPKKFAPAIPWFGGLMVVEGLILLVHGIRLSLPPFPFYADTAACLLLGSGILLLYKRAKITGP